MTKQSIRVEYAQLSDLEAICEAERRTHRQTLPYPEDWPILGEIDYLPPYAWQSKQILAAVRKYRSSKQKQNDTRVLVARRSRRFKDNKTGRMTTVKETVGAMIYEIKEKCFRFTLLTVDPEKIPDKSDRADVLGAMVSYVITKAKRSETRKQIRMAVPDGHYSLLAWFVANGWTYHRSDRYFKDGNDAWLVETTLPEAQPSCSGDVAAS